MGCRTSFQLRTVEVGGDPIEIARPDPEPPCDMPAAECCLEPQHFPDSVHHPDWPSIVCTPEAPYAQRLEVEIGRG
jgi:aldose 1-epimerase